MAVGDRLKGIFKGRLSRNLEDPAERSAAIEEAFQQVAKGGDGATAIESLYAALDQGAIETEELLSRAVAEFPDSESWLELYVRRLLRKESLTAAETAQLQREAVRQRWNVSLWRRLFEERRRLKDQYMRWATTDMFVLATGRYFPEPNRDEWLDADTKAEARKLFDEKLKESLDRIEDSRRADENGQRIIELGMAHHPDRTALMPLLAMCHRAAGRKDEKALEVALLASMHHPNDPVLKRWCARLLMECPGREQQGLDMLRQAAEDFPMDAEIGKDLVDELRKAEHLGEHDVKPMKRWFAANPGDTTAAELLADFLVSRDVKDREAIEIYRAAAKTSPNRNRYLRLIGQSQATQGHWADVIETLDSIRVAEGESPEVAIPLATAYAEMGRSDADAVAAFQRATALGARHPLIHDLLCRHYYLHKGSDPGAIRQFKETLALVPDCSWAKLGNIRHLLATEDFQRAFDESFKLVQSAPNDVEATRMLGEALAGNPHRTQLRKLEGLPDRAVLGVLDKAYAARRDVLTLCEALVRARLKAGMRDQETAKMLGELCRRNPDAIPLRIARADVLWDLGQRENAASLYRELVDRWRAAGPDSSSVAQAPPLERNRVLARVTEHILSGNPGPEDADILIENMANAQAEPEQILAVARLFVARNIDHPMRGALLDRAAAFAPEDEQLEMAIAESRAVRGNPRPALRLALRALSRRHSGDAVVSLLELAVQLAKPDQLTRDLVDDMVALRDRSDLPDRAVVAVAEGLALAGRAGGEERALFDRAVALAPANTRLLGAAGRCHAASGDDRKAAELYARAVGEEPASDDLVLQLVHTHIRLHLHSSSMLDTARRAAGIAPDDVEIQIHLGSIYLEMGEVGKAVPIFDGLLRRRSDLGTRLLTTLEHGTRTSTNQGPLLLLQARASIAAGRVEQGLAILGRLQPNYQRYLGEMMHCYEEIIHAAPENARARIERGILWRLTGQLDEAAEDLKVATTLSPANDNILAEYAEVESQRLAHNKVRDPGAWSDLAMVWMELDEKDEAGSAIGMALEADPGNKMALVLRARLEINAGDFDDAHATLRRLERNDAVVSMLQELARHFEDRGEHVKAAECLTDALDVSNQQREVIERLRSLHEQQARNAISGTEREEVMSGLSARAQRRYELREQIGKGSMGLVYLAYDSELDEIVVLKILPESVQHDAEALARFRLEAKAARKLAHPNIVRIHDIGEEGGRRHLSMEYVDGGDLKTRLAGLKEPMELDEAVRIVRQVARALHHAHSEGVLHRDIKPANILLTSAGKVKLSDFGIAALTEAAGRQPRDVGATDTMAGTPLYMSPEQFAGDAVGRPADLYSLGVLFYEMLAGAPPFVRGSISYHHQFTPPPPLPPDVPKVLRDVVGKLLSKRPEERYQTADQLLRGLDEYEGGGQRNRSIDIERTPIMG